MKKVHSYLSPKCQAAPQSSINRFGVFAKENIQSGELLVIWGGYILNSEEMEKLPSELRDNYPLQVYDDLYLSPTSVDDLDDAEFFNHSCAPNAGVKGQNILVARREIEAGEEVCFDYETTDSEGVYLLCKCGSPECRKVLHGESWKDPEFQKKNEGFFSWYLQEKINSMREQKISHTAPSSRQTLLAEKITKSISRQGARIEERGEYS
jgi:hypothetical protein